MEWTTAFGMSGRRAGGMFAKNQPNGNGYKKVQATAFCSVSAFAFLSSAVGDEREIPKERRIIV